jgi:hypothetical protein
MASSADDKDGDCEIIEFRTSKTGVLLIDIDSDSEGELKQEGRGKGEEEESEEEGEGRQYLEGEEEGDVAVSAYQPTPAARPSLPPSPAALAPMLPPAPLLIDRRVEATEVISRLNPRPKP